MKIKAIKTYQAVSFQKSLHNYFTAERDAFRDLELELLKDVGCVAIKSAKDHILVPLTNVAFMIPLTAQTKGKDTKLEPKIQAVSGDMRD